jgi:hypothetical protein
MTGSDFICGQIALKAYQDGFSEGLDGMRAICHVLKNRVDAGWWGGSWIDVLSHHRDYSYRVEPYPDTLPDPRVYSFQCLLQEVNRIFNGSQPDDILVPANPSFASHVYKPALYYGRLDQITSDHFLDDISRRPDIHPRISQVGMLFFFA